MNYSQGDAPKNEKPSLLADILKASQEKSHNTPISPDIHGHEPLESTPKKPKEPISPAVFAKFIGSLLFISVIFFGSFLAYIAFNPDKAQFFVSRFGIDPADVKALLSSLINVTFGCMLAIMSIVWIVTLFRAFWVPKELKRKRLLSWLTAGITGIILFSIFSFWAFLFRYVNANEYDPNAHQIKLYDLSLYNVEKYRKISQIHNTVNMIGPIEILFDLRGNAKYISSTMIVEIEKFRIDFDGADCNGNAIVEGTNALEEQSISCRFDQSRSYDLVGSYTVRKRDGTAEEIPMTLPSIQIRGLIDVKNNRNQQGKKIVTYDASDVLRLGSPTWKYENEKVVKQNAITENITQTPQAICFNVYTEGQGIYKDANCDLIFVLLDRDNKTSNGGIMALQDQNDSQSFYFSLTGVTIDPNEVIRTDWIVNGQDAICKNEPKNCKYTFSDYGRKKIKATLITASEGEYTYETEILVNEPITVVKHIKVTRLDGTLMNDNSTYDTLARAYVLRNSIVPPEKLLFDARDVVPGNDGYILDKVIWKISYGNTTEEKHGEKVEIEFNQPLRYTVNAEIFFKKSSPGESDRIDTATEHVIIDIERKSLMPRMDVMLSSDYVPSIVTVDASQSSAEKGEIKKFIFDFGEGRTPAEGDAIQKYQYSISGEKTITLTIISASGEKAELTRTIVLKDQIKTVDFMPSMASGVPGTPVDFEAIGTNGMVEDYVWNFGDNTPVSHGYNVTHVFSDAGRYPIALTIIYADGTRKETKKDYIVSNE